MLTCQKPSPQAIYLEETGEESGTRRAGGGSSGSGLCSCADRGQHLYLNDLAFRKGIDYPSRSFITDLRLTPRGGGTHAALRHWAQ
jgi:hypothetical protein